VSPKFDYYDAIAHLIPGTIGCLVILYFCDILSVTLPKPEVGSLSGLGIGIALAYTVGHLLQSIASVFEPAFYFIWGGKPSVNLLDGGSDYFNDDERRQLIQEFVGFFGIPGSCPHEKKARRNYYQRLFQRCMAVCNRNKLGRVEIFVTAYGFHRVVLTTFLLTFGICLLAWGAHKSSLVPLPAGKLGLLSLVTWISGISTLIEVFRARKRAYYYAHEVIAMTSDYIRSNKATANPG
jgi:hypothetical protein